MREENGVALSHVGGMFASMQDHRRLRIWSRSHVLAVEVRRATRRFPRRDYGPLKNQLTRAVESVVFNIVDGCGASSKREFARFLNHSIQSSSEVEEQLELAKDYGIIPGREYHALSSEVVQIRRMICRYRAKILRSLDPPPEPG